MIRSPGSAGHRPTCPHRPTGPVSLTGGDGEKYYVSGDIAFDPMAEMLYTFVNTGGRTYGTQERKTTSQAI
jgi:hypothetical protein